MQGCQDNSEALGHKGKKRSPASKVGRKIKGVVIKLGNLLLVLHMCTYA